MRPYASALLLFLSFSVFGSPTPGAAQTPPLCLDEDQNCADEENGQATSSDADEGGAPSVVPGGALLGAEKGDPFATTGQAFGSGEPFSLPSDQTVGSALPPGLAGDFELRASRTFVGPHVFPPEEYAAYGIVAFPELSSTATRDRHLLVCEAYVATLPEVSDLAIPPAEQMVTVWPVNSDELAAELSGLGEHQDRLQACGTAVANYDLETALTAIRQAGRAQGLNFGNQGPFLLAWSPASTKGAEDALVLVADLSDVRTSEAMRLRFREWRDRIEQDESLWRDGWTIERLRVSLRDWADHWGGIVFSSGAL